MPRFNLVAVAVLCTFAFLVPDVTSKQSGCGKLEIDLFFLLDASGSVGEINFEKSKTFVADVVRHFTIGKNDVQVGLASFSSQVFPKFNLKSYVSAASLIDAIKAITYDQGGTNTGLALDWIRKKAFTHGSGDRRSAHNVLVVLTDGKSISRTQTLTAARLLHHQNLTVYAIGIGPGPDSMELNAIATDKQHMITVGNFDELRNLAAKIKQMECDAIPTTHLPTTTTTHIRTQVATDLNRVETTHVPPQSVSVKTSPRSTPLNVHLPPAEATRVTTHVVPVTTKTVSTNLVPLTTTTVSTNLVPITTTSVPTHTVPVKTTTVPTHIVPVKTTPVPTNLVLVKTTTVPAHLPPVSSMIIQSSSYCDVSPCRNKGTCVPISSGYHCFCERGYIGKDCEIDEDDCINEPCMYGQCIDKLNGYQCRCQALFYGKNCAKMRFWGIMAISVGSLLTLTTCCCCMMCLPSCRRRKEDENGDAMQQQFPVKKIEAWS